MATIYWLGTADAVAQVVTITVGGTFSGETFTISVGGVAIASHTETGGQTADQIATALVAAWNASTHAYATPVTAAATGGGSGALTLTADTSGVPFTVTLNTPGGSATFGQAATVANAGPNDWSTGANWSGGSVPGGADDVVIADSGVSILWLPTAEQTINSLTIRQSFTGALGLNPLIFQKTATTTNTAKAEYRQTHLKVATATANIGEHTGTGTPAGSGRIRIDFGSGTAATCTIHNSATTPTDTNTQPIHLLAAHASSTLYVKKGVVGLATLLPGQTSTWATVRTGYLSGVADDVALTIGGGVTLTTLTVGGGANAIANAPTTVNALRGSLGITGTGTITTLDIGNGASIDTRSSGKTITNTIMAAGSSYKTDRARVTHTNGIDLDDCGIEDVTLEVGRHVNLALTAA